MRPRRRRLAFALALPSLASLGGDRFGLDRIRITIAQLRGIRQLRLAVAELAFDTDPEIESLGRGRRGLYHRPHPSARFLVPRLFVRDERDAVARKHVARLRDERAAEIRFGEPDVTHRLRAAPG